MHYQKIDPPPVLRLFMRGLWYLSLDLANLPAGYEVLPDGYTEIIFHFGSPCYRATPAGPQPLPSPVLIGLLQQPVRLYATGRVDFLGVHCFPWTVMELLDLPAGPHSRRRLAQLHAHLDKLLQADQVPAALTLLTQYFLTGRSPLVNNSSLHRAGAAMLDAHGTLPVSQIASVACATVRTMERQVKQATGYSVKHLSGLMRFEQARNQLWLEPASSLAGLAQAVGYADQAHLSREFKRYSGTTPAVFARASAQASSASGLDFVAFVQD